MKTLFVFVVIAAVLAFATPASAQDFECDICEFVVNYIEQYGGIFNSIHELILI